ncbi:MAG TPA: DALR domain-containing protein, partial [Candidatus Acidoferrales bacterium]|nr:DALR domain-containing protein [Candidatus Acidoferrales bacterium]
FAKGIKPSTIRFLLASVPYRRQLNFTKDSLTQAASSVERLRNFISRLETGKFPPGTSDSGSARAQLAEEDLEKGFEDDLNTAVALAAIFDLVRDANSSMDRGEFRQGDAAAVLAAMRKFDGIFAVLTDDDAQKLARLGFHGDERAGMSDAQAEVLVAERQDARKRRDFSRADEIRRRLADSGIIIEDARDGGVRWKRK